MTTRDIFNITSMQYILTIEPSIQLYAEKHGYECNYCEQIFNNQAKYRNHMIVKHDEPDPYDDMVYEFNRKLNDIFYFLLVLLEEMMKINITIYYMTSVINRNK